MNEPLKKFKTQINGYEHKIDNYLDLIEKKNVEIDRLLAIQSKLEVELKVK